MFARFACLAIAIAGIALPAFAAQKMDAHLQRMTQDPAHLQREVLQQKRGPVPTIDVIVRVTGDGLDQLKAEGARIRSVLGEIVTADIPAGRIAAIADLDGVAYIEASRPVPPRLNASVPATRASLLRTGVLGTFAGVTGRNVIVGVADDGVDFRHGDFRNADGSTRLIALWDQRDSATYGTPPTGLGYGTECTPQMINTAIAGSGGCQQPSSGGHGTHVAGIAAGNGRGTGSSQPADRFIGMAPEADIIAANSLGAGVRGAGVLDAVNFMAARAKSLGKPIAINLSLGSYFGPRDGTSNFEKGLDSASEAGVVIIAAAGNEGDAPIRATGSLAQGGTAQFSVRLPAASTQTSGRFEIWYPGTHAYAVSIAPPGCAPTAVVNPGDPVQSQETACGAISVTSTGTQANNDDRQILIELANGTSQLVRDQDYVITVTGTTVPGGPVTVSAICGETAGGLVFPAGTAPVTSQILTDASSATRVIAVGAYNTNYQWNNASGPFTHPGTGPIGDAASFSSRGPRRDCSNLAKCPQVMKPEITAPGSVIMSTYASDIDTNNASQPDVIEADGVHTGYTGTSMATPHVTGAVALLLSRNGTLTPEQVKAILYANVQTNAFTTGLPAYSASTPLLPANPNFTFGYGLLDAKLAYDATPGGAPANPPRLANISTRGRVETGNDVMIGGFVIGGASPKKVLVTARGPSLTAFGVTGAMANPTLQLFSGQTVIAANDDWQTNANAAEITATGIAPTNAQEAALLVTLNPGAYTAIVSGVGGGMGVGIVEVFERDRTDIPLINISTRGQVQTGDNVMIGGFIIQGDAPKTVLVTARGPSLAPFGITNPLANPNLQLFSGQTLIASNDDFGTAPNLVAIQATGVAPANALESAILITLNPGAYTAIVTGVGGGTGVGIVEVFAR